ncbi:MAG TPA: hypothetical protein VJX67_14300 [Blastocatellia bacterium]|nr:hypothetical protein [Blastocatellia bacterium]
MLEVLRHTCEVCAEKFKSGTLLSLDLYHDPEIDDQYLVIYVRQPHYEPDILDQIDLVSEVFSEDLAALSGWLLVTTDFRPPDQTSESNSTGQNTLSLLNSRETTTEMPLTSNPGIGQQ